VAITKALASVGLPEDTLHRYPHEFSGGQRQRIALARAVVLKPKLLVLDEPTSALDASTQREVLDLLRRLQQELGMTYLLISHDFHVIRAACHRVMVMRGGKIVEMGAADDIFASPRDPYTQELIRAAFLQVDESRSR
jgi:microcin C transport system ATP-binding protein